MYNPTIGLEIHAELATKTKMFCDCLNDSSQIEPNVNVCPICLAHPGTLPKANQSAIDFVIKTGLALNCQINSPSKFDRKNYFYPDLPKAYQISQYDQPLCFGGYMILPSSGKKIRITRIHLEEDTGRLAHSALAELRENNESGQRKSASNRRESASLVDFNRAGVPLMELVTEPDFNNSQDVVEFAKEFQLLLRTLGVSYADMEKGQLRVEVNISIKKQTDADNTPKNTERELDNQRESALNQQKSAILGTKVEIKNLNSFRAVGGAVAYELERQEKELEKNNLIKQETRGWDEKKQKTISQRSKEEAHDYRYFPEPDLPPMTFSPDYIKNIKNSLPELPSQKRIRFSQEYNLSQSQVELLVFDLYLADFFEKAVSELISLDPSGNPLTIYNYLASDVRGLEADRKITIAQSKLEPQHLAQLAYLISQSSISSRVAKDILANSFDAGTSPEIAVKEGGLLKINSENELEGVVKEVIDENEKVCYDYKNGKENALQFLLGQVMAKTKGKADPGVARQVIVKLIKE